MATFLVSLVAFTVVALLLGVHLTGLIALNPALRALDANTYLAAKRAIDHTAPRLAKPLMLAGIAVTTATVVAGVVFVDVRIVVAAAIALVALIVTLLAILRGDQPANRVMAGWSVDQLPADWQSVRDRWERFFAIRTGANLLALGALVTALLFVIRMI